MTANLRFRLLVLLLVPLMLLAAMGGWFSYSAADEASTQHDQRLLRLLPALADSVLAPSIADGTPPLVSLTPSVEDFCAIRAMKQAMPWAICKAMWWQAIPGSASMCLRPARRNSIARSTTV
jgi:hypothetical protein